MAPPAPPTDARPPWRIVAGRVKRDLKDGRASVLAGGVAFYCFLALVPALTALVSLYGLVADPRDVARQLDTLAPLLPAQVRAAMQGASAVMHLAAETHVDRSIQGAAPFVRTNVLGTQTLLAAALAPGAIWLITSPWFSPPSRRLTPR